MTASPGAESQLIQPSKSPSVAQQSLSVEVKENQAIVATATLGPSSVEYWVRCLPHDFTPIQMVRHGATTPGYYLVGDIFAPPAAPGFAMVVDGNGVPVWYYAQPRTAPFNSTSGVFDVDMVVPGTISFIPWPSLDSASPFEIHDLSPLKTTYVAAAGLTLDSHELHLLPNGDFLMFTDQDETGIDLTGYPGLNALREPFGPNGTLLPCDVLEINPKTGKLVWKWVATDHFDAVKDATYPGVSGDDTGVTVADPFHCNSIDVDPTGNGNLLISSRDMDSVFYIEKSSGKVLWKMGGATYSKDNAAYVPVADPFLRQHDARFQPGWSNACGGKGQISLFDDETATDNPARAAVYDVNVGVGTGCAKAGATVAWQFAGATSSGFMGSFRILEDGSRVIGWGYEGQSKRIVTEVDVHGNDLLDFYFLDGSSSFRGLKVPLSALDLGAMRKTAGLPPLAPPADAGEEGSAGSDAGTGDAGGLESDGGLEVDGASDAGDDGSTGKDATTADSGPDE
jgi:hypothetical protein